MRPQPSDVPHSELLELLSVGNADALIERFSRSTPRTVSIVPNFVVPRRLIACYRAGLAAERVLGQISGFATMHNILRTAEIPLRTAARALPQWPDAKRALARNLWFQGRHSEALHWFAEAERVRNDLAKLAGWDQDSRVLLPQNCASIIGLMGHIDAFVKRKILSSDRRQYVLLAPERDIVNAEFLNYWMDYVAVVTDAQEIAAMAATDPALGVNWNWVLPDSCDGVEYVHRGIAKIQRQWQQENRPPLLSLKPEHAAALSRQKLAWGMTDSDWFVCLHVRSAGYYCEKPGTAEAFRNTPIEDYVPMIRDVVAAGGWVVRMGDPSMPLLDTTQDGFDGRVIDYAHSPERSPALDVALCASCRLYVGVSSGLHCVPHAFGRPVCLVNCPIYIGFPWHSTDVFVPPRYFSREQGRFLSFDEILSSDVVYADHGFLQERAGIELLRNSPDEIGEAVREALSPDDYTTASEERGRTVRAQFERLNHVYDTQIFARVALYFAAKHADELIPSRPVVRRAVPITRRKLDVIVPSYNRPARLHHLLKSGLRLAIPGMFFVVIDDGSTLAEEIPGLGLLTTEQVCESFKDDRVIYIRNPENVGVAVSWERYYCEFCSADYTLSVTDKDEFINASPIVQALAKLDADPTLSMVVLPLRQRDRETDDRTITPAYTRLSSSEYLGHYVQDTALQHCSMWGIIRVDAIRKAGVPRPMNLRRYGLDDGFGIDIDFVFMVAATGDVDFESEPHVKRSTLAGGTERSPLTFAYTYYQYAKRAMRDLQARGVVTRGTVRQYLGWWQLLICRGLVVSYRPVHGTEIEQGTARIRRHLRWPILLYLLLEALRYGITPTAEALHTFLLAVRLVIGASVRLWKSRLSSFLVKRA